MKSDFKQNQNNDSHDQPLGEQRHYDLRRKRQLKAGGQQGEQQDILKFLFDLTLTQEDLVRYETAYGATYLVNNPDYIAYVLQSSNYPRISVLRMGLGEGLLS